MRIAFTHNLKIKNSLDEAEYDTKETVDFITEVLTTLGHRVDLVEVSGPISEVITNLEALNPDLIFNTAEGKTGKLREAIYPAIFEQLSIPYTGSNGYCCALTLDKFLTKLQAKEHGIPTPSFCYITKLDDLHTQTLKYPIIVKPNFEGSSKGINQKSVVTSQKELKEVATELLKEFKQGLILEEFIAGRDITIGYLEAVKGTGLLEPVEYDYGNKFNEQENRYNIYDYKLKNEQSDLVNLVYPANITEKNRQDIKKYSEKIVEIFNIKDFCRIDFRISLFGEVYFLEVNALPSLEPGSSLYLSAEKGVNLDQKGVIEQIIKSATNRFQAELKSANINGKNNNKKRPLRIGFSYNEKRVVPKEDPNTDQEAEYDSPKTLNSIRSAIRSFGHEVVDLEATPDFPGKLMQSKVDLVFNMAEGISGRYRESQVPAILELTGIPFTGSDSAALALTLDKSLAKRVVQEVGVKTANFVLLINGKEAIPKSMRFPMMVKPVAEGSSKGVLGKSVVQNEKELRDVAKEMIQKYKQSALVEEFLVGREFTVGLIGEFRPKAFPPMEIVFQNKEDKYPIYAYQHKLDVNDEIKYEIPAKLDKKLEDQLLKAAKKSFRALGCRDYARIDFRLDASNEVNFIECNPLPGLTPHWSDLCLITESVGMSYEALIGEILAPAIRRFKEAKNGKRSRDFKGPMYEE